MTRGENYLEYDVHSDTHAPFVMDPTIRAAVDDTLHGIKVESRGSETLYISRLYQEVRVDSAGPEATGLAYGFLTGNNRQAASRTDLCLLLPPYGQSLSSLLMAAETIRQSLSKLGLRGRDGREVPFLVVGGPVGDSKPKFSREDWRAVGLGDFSAYGRALFDRLLPRVIPDLETLYVKTYSGSAPMGLGTAALAGRYGVFPATVTIGSPGNTVASRPLHELFVSFCREVVAARGYTDGNPDVASMLTPSELKYWCGVLSQPVANLNVFFGLAKGPFRHQLIDVLRAQPKTVITTGTAQDDLITRGIIPSVRYVKTQLPELNGQLQVLVRSGDRHGWGLNLGNLATLVCHGTLRKG
jgi:hypothetical protein